MKPLKPLKDIFKCHFEHFKDIQYYATFLNIRKMSTFSIKRDKIGSVWNIERAFRNREY